ncbi:hypothetical protein [Chryseobacterium sp.]|uniref:hypothetical protein n=1 Tax=Chryseobacterium sp. TaxID=1871047 RepID=UPI0028A298ED|nr:hypothetical protein [Chryseobacterium sp.]
MATTTPISTILSWFQTGDFPTEAQFAASWSSFRHKDDKVPMDKIDGLATAMQDKTDKPVFETHLTGSDAHITTLAKLDASNLNNTHILSWKSVLGVGDLPENIATVDDLNNDLYGNVWSKQQSDALYMILDEFVQDGKLRADKIEALGLTTILKDPLPFENTIAGFAANAANYEFQENDIIPIPDGNGNFALYFYIGGEKNIVKNYLPTGLTNITIAMVEGLQAALDNKVNKPVATGNYFINYNGAVNYKSINPPSNYLNYWNGSNFTGSGIYTDGTKFGIGTTSPTEALHLSGGRIRSKALVFDENSETLPYQITYANRAYYGSDLTGAKYRFMFQTYADLHNLLTGLTDPQKTQVRNDLRSTGENFSVGTPRIDVLLLPFIDNTKNFIQYTTLVGINLFVDNVTPNAYIKIKRIKDVNGTNLPAPEVYDVDNFTVLQNFPNNLNFGINWSTKPEGYYQVFVTHNGLTNVSSPELIVKAGLTYSQFNGITNWKINSGNGSVNDTGISLGQPCHATTDELISIDEINAGFMVSFSVNNGLGNYGADMVGWWHCGLTGADDVFYGVVYGDPYGAWRIQNGTDLPVRNDTFHIAYYNGVVYVIAEGNGATYQQFNNTYNLYPRRFSATRFSGGQGSLSMTLLGKILLS